MRLATHLRYAVLIVLWWGHAAGFPRCMQPGGRLSSPLLTTSRATCGRVQPAKLHSATALYSSAPLDSTLAEGLQSLVAINANAQRAMQIVAGQAPALPLPSMRGSKLDCLIMLLASSTISPLFKAMRLSPFIGFLLLGAAAGPGGWNSIHSPHLFETLGEIGVLFFVFEMGLELSVERLKAMVFDVVGIGSAQFLCTSALLVAFFLRCGQPAPAAIALGGSLALSSSVFVLQLLKDHNASSTRYGGASLGILLLQDLAVVPLLVVVQMIGRGEANLARVLALTGIKAALTILVLAATGRPLLSSFLSAVERFGSREAYLAATVSIVLLMSALTKAIGLSDTLGAFVAGLLLSRSSHRHRAESDIALVRGLFLGLFFISVGFSIGARLLLSHPWKVLGSTLGLIACKSAITSTVAYLFGISPSNSIRTGLLTAQGGEFAFVSLSIARRLKLLSKPFTDQIFTAVALSMALTPALLTVANGIVALLGINAGDPGSDSVPAGEQGQRQPGAT